MLGEIAAISAIALDGHVLFSFIFFAPDTNCGIQ